MNINAIDVVNQSMVIHIHIQEILFHLYMIKENLNHRLEIILKLKRRQELKNSLYHHLEIIFKLKRRQEIKNLLYHHLEIILKLKRRQKLKNSQVNQL